MSGDMPGVDGFNGHPGQMMTKVMSAVRKTVRYTLIIVHAMKILLLSQLLIIALITSLFAFDKLPIAMEQDTVYFYLVGGRRAFGLLATGVLFILGAAGVGRRESRQHTGLFLLSCFCLISPLCYWVFMF